MSAGITSKLSSSYSKKSNSRMYMPNFCSVSVVSCCRLSVLRSLLADTSSVDEAIDDCRSSSSDVWLKMTWRNHKTWWNVTMYFH